MGVGRLQMKILVTKLESDKCGHHQTFLVRSNDIVEVQFHARLNLALVTLPGCSILGTVGSYASVVTLKGPPQPPQPPGVPGMSGQPEFYFLQRSSPAPLCLYYGSRFPS